MVNTDPSNASTRPPTDDDERTVVGGSINGGAALPFGHALQEYVIEGLVGEGGFGIVYLARDTRLGRNVALKEYMPANLATRGSNHTVSVRSERHRETFELGLRSFVNEAQLLASFDHPSLVKVYRFWEDNGTAYMVMPFYQGPTLKKFLSELGQPPDERWLMALLSPMIDALEQLHNDHCYHRDIAPDNILLLPLQGTQAGAAATTVRPLLLDFGAARRVIGDVTHALTVILKPGYAPIEQYADSAAMKQGPWTDVYALCAVLYACVTGRAPVPSVSRVISDEMLPAAQAGAGRFSPMFLEAIDAGLAVRPDARPQSMVALRELFASTSHGEVRPMPAVATSPLRTVMPQPAVRGTVPTATPATRIEPQMTAPALSEQTIVAPRAGSQGSAIPSSTSRTSAEAGLRAGAAAGTRNTAATASRKAQFAAALVAAALLAVGTWWWLGNKGSPEPSRTMPTPSMADATTVTGSASTSVLPAPPVAEPAGLPAPVATGATALQPEPAAFTVLGALQDIVARGEPSIAVTAVTDTSTLTIGKDLLGFRVKSSEPGFLYIFSGGTDKSHFWMLFPNRLDGNNRIEAGRELILPRRSWEIEASGPPGTNHIVALVSRHARDLGAPGLLRTDDMIPEFDLNVARQLWSRREAGSISPFIGKARCDAPPCDEAYGARLLEITEVAGPRPGNR